MVAAAKPEPSTLDLYYPEPTIADLLTFKNRVNRHRQQWLREVAVVRQLRYHQDLTPEKWQQRLNIPEDRRFRTNLSANEIERVTALMGRNRPKVYIPPVGESTPAVARGQSQSRWTQQFLDAIERTAILPLWARGDDAAVETGLGAYEWYLTEQWEEYCLVAEQRDHAQSQAERKALDSQLREIGLPFQIRMIDPQSVLWEPDDHGPGSAGKVLIVERKSYAQVYALLRDQLTTDEFADAQLPAVSSQGYPPETFRIQYRDFGGTMMFYDAIPDNDGEVEVMRYYDRRWCVEIVAGRIVDSYEHGLPGVPVFLQFGKVTSNPYMGFQLRGVTFGMIEQELALNDNMTFVLDNMMTYGRPFPVIETAVDGEPLMDPSGQPMVLRLNDPRQPPQLGRGQKIVDAFQGFHGQIDQGFLALMNQYFRTSGMNPIAQGEAPGADASGYALNTLSQSATSIYQQIIVNKQRCLQNILDFTRLAIRDVIQGTVWLSIESWNEAEGRTDVEFLSLGPEDIDEVPSRVVIDPLSDAQRLAITEWLRAGNQEGYVPRRDVQRVGYGSVIEDPDQADDAIMLDRGMEALMPVIIQSVMQQIQQEGFPETLGGGQGGPPQPGGPVQPPAGGPMMGAPSGPGPEPTAPALGSGGAQASQGGASALQAMHNLGRGGQQPMQQGIGPNRP